MRLTNPHKRPVWLAVRGVFLSGVKVMFYPVTAALLAAILSVATTARADEQNIPYCLHTEELAPHGIVLKMGDAYYRACRPRGEEETFPGISLCCASTPRLFPI